MMCPVCQSDTSVKDSRPQENGTIKRRRVCASGHKMTTWESTVPPDAILRKRATYNTYKAKWIERNPELHKQHQRRGRLRRQARMEAKQTGEPVEVIYQRWGVAA